MVDNNAIGTTEDGQRKQVHSENGIIIPSLMGSNKNQEEVVTWNLPKGVTGKRRKGGSATKHKKRKNQTKISTQIISVAIEVLLHPPRHKTLLLPIKGINLEERSASIASVHLLHLIHHRHLVPRSLQRQEIEKGRWVANSKQVKFRYS